MYKINYLKIAFIVFFAITPCLSRGQYCSKIPIFEKKTSASKPFIMADTLKHKNNNNGIYIGVNLGFYFANRYTAQHYDGRGISKYYGNGITNIDYVLNLPYNHQDITNLLGYDFKSEEIELPTKMKYNPALLLGFYTKYNIKNFGIFAQFNFAKIRTSDVFTIKIMDSHYPTANPTYKQEAIYGAEQRVNIDIGFSYTFNSEEKTKPYIELGYNLNNTKFLESKIKIEGREYSIIDPYYSYYQIEQAGVGMGAFLGGGVELNFNESISINPGFNLYYSKIKLGDYNDKYNLNYSLFVRAILNGLL